MADTVYQLDYQKVVHMGKGSEAVIKWRRRMKQKAVEYLGGKCSRCGYDRCVRALSFHHRDSTTKSFGIANPSTKRWELIKAELDKCDLLCMNCHMEIEDKIYWGVAQSVQHRAVNAAVRKDIEGSSPSAPANFKQSWC